MGVVWAGETSFPLQMALLLWQRDHHTHGDAKGRRWKVMKDGWICRRICRCRGSGESAASILEGMEGGDPWLQAEEMAATGGEVWPRHLEHMLMASGSESPRQQSYCVVEMNRSIPRVSGANSICPIAMQMHVCRRASATQQSLAFA